MTQTILFEEKQQINPKWVAALFIVLYLLVAMGYLSQIRSEPDADSSTLFPFYFCLLFIVLGHRIIASIQLQTLIKEDGIYVRFAPFHRSYTVYHWPELSEIYIRNYHPLQEYNGWGIKQGISGKAYSLSGSTGIQLKLKNGSLILIGTQRPAEAAAVLKIMGKLSRPFEK